MPTTSSPKLTRTIQLQSPSTQQDSMGQPIQSWTTVRTCWAEIDVQQSQLIYATSEFVEKVTHRITFRWCASPIITPNMRIVYTEPTTNITHNYRIEAVLNPRQANVYVTVLCYELDGAE